MYMNIQSRKAQQVSMHYAVFKLILELFIFYNNIYTHTHIYRFLLFVLLYMIKFITAVFKKKKLNKK